MMMARRRLLVAVLLLAASAATGELHDVISPHLLPPACGCKKWTDAPEHDQYWRNPASIKLAESSCAQQGRGNPNFVYDGDRWRSRGVHFGGGAQAHYISAYCVANTTGKLVWCASGFGVPEQVNVQVASHDTVVVGWVTFEHKAPTLPPVVSVVGGGEVEGITHIHVPCSVGPACTGDMWNGSSNTTERPYYRPPYYMHFVRLSKLKPRSKVAYKVRSGATSAAWSDTFTFRAPYSGADGGPTRIALYGDMGVYSWNNMQNLYEETSLNETADLILHGGDHCCESCFRPLV
jgi:hypothetical protein